ncbi:MAG: hypothetical protein ACI362_02305, partial [Coriobacteriales bacterium]
SGKSPGDEGRKTDIRHEKADAGVLMADIEGAFTFKITGTATFDNPVVCWSMQKAQYEERAWISTTTR